MATQKTAQTGALLLNAPVVPNNFFNPADYGAFCRCAGAAGNFVEFEAGITLEASPTLAIIDKVTYTDSYGVAQSELLSKQYLINNATPAAVLDELVAEIKKIFAKYVLNGGGLTYVVNAGVLTIGGTFQAPFVPTAIYVDNAAVAFA